MDEMTGAAFLEFMARMKKLRDRTRMNQLVEYFELDPARRIRKMSKGTKQKVGLVCAFMTSPDIVLLDEPTSGLDPLMQSRFIDLVLEEKRRGATILLSSHLFDEVERTCDRVAFIRAGRLAAVERMNDVRKSRKRVFAVTFADETTRDRYAQAHPDARKQGAASVEAAVAGNPDAFVKDLAAYDIVDLAAREQTLEELFMHLYGTTNQVEKGALMNRTLFAKELRANLFVSLIIAAVLAMYIGVIVSMYDPELGESLDAMMQSMPEMFAAFGMSVQATTLIDFMLNYLYGFLLTIFILVLILIVANKLMVRYLDRGAMAYLLATPNSRTRIALTMVGVMVTILVALMAVVTSLEAGFAEALFPGELDMQALMQVNAGLLALWLAMAGLCFLSACLFSNATAALWVGGGLNILFFLMQMVSQVGDKFEFLKNVNPLTLFDYYGLAAGDASAVGGAIALTVGAVALFAVAVAAFDRRDLSI